MSRERHSLTLVKGRERFVFTYAEGREADLLAALVSLAEDPESGIDYYDAAALSFQLGQPARAENRPVARAVMGPRL
ncbi:MAG: hypothetical protein PVJ57_05565 [Phycisphaerae bacterium]|jgi:hypothetical protein